MVIRATSVPNSINKISVKNGGGRLVRQSDRNSFRNTKRSQSLNRDVKKTNTIKKNDFKEIKPQQSKRNTPVIVRSRDNEIGSTDTLDIIGTRSAGSEPTTPEDNINVVVRVRPLNTREKRGSHDMVLQFPGNGQIVCSSDTPASSHGQNSKVFTYNVVFEPLATQADVLEYSGIKRIVQMAVEGFSCTAFCYGQTGSGKTYTLTGPPDLFKIEKRTNVKDDRHGLILRSFIYLFQLLNERKDTHFILKASFLEIYNEKVKDLLNPNTTRKPLAVRWSKKSRSFFVENLFTIDCEELDDLLAVLEEGIRNRSVGSHQMNDHSSRSHTMLTVHIDSEQQAEGGVFISKQGKINFVDLAGSEMTKKTQSEGKTLEEANNINKSLMVLGTCIASLSDVKKRSGHIPYRDSQLTKLLLDSLAGNGVTLMIACVSPAHSNYNETLNTLRYASRAKKIPTRPVIYMDPREALILSLKREIAVLLLENDHLKAALNFQTENINQVRQNLTDRSEIPAAPSIDLERLPELDSTELAELVKLYMRENEALRIENAEIFQTRELLLRDQEIVCRENERLLKKIEDVNNACTRSPLLDTRLAANSENIPNGSSDIWTNPLNDPGGKDEQESRNTSQGISKEDKPNTNKNKVKQKEIGRNIINLENSLTQRILSNIKLPNKRNISQQNQFKET